MALIGWKRGSHGTITTTAADITAVQAIYGANCVQVFSI